MRTTPRSLPVYLALWPGRPGAYFRARTPAGAAGQAVGAGLGEPPVIHYAGYAAYPELPTRKRRSAPGQAAPIRVGRRAEAALTVYGLLRVDWPLGSILGRAAAEHQHQASPAALRDFLADMGAAIESLTTPRHLLDAAVHHDARAWWYKAKERQARRLGEGLRADQLADRRRAHFERARSLRRRKQYGQATAELDGALAGNLEAHQGVAEAFAAQLVGQGLGADDVASLVKRARRITIPRL